MLARVRTITSDHTPPDTACFSYRELYRRLAELELRTHEHVHVENDIYVPRAVALEDRWAAVAAWAQSCTALLAMGTILLTGATGFVGARLHSLLEASGYDVRGVTRDAGKARRRFPDREWIEADLGNRDAVRKALRGCSTAYYLVHGMGTPGDYRRREAEDAAIFAQAASEEGLQRIVYLGGVHPTVGEDASSEHLLSRARVGEILAAGAVPVLELRASMIVGNGSLSFLIVRDLAARLPFMILPRWLDSRTEPVAIDDVLIALERGLRLELPRSQAFDLPGPEILSGRQILMRTAGALGLAEPLVVRVPVLTPGLSARWVRFVTRAEWAVAKEIVVGLTTDLVAKDSRYWTSIGHEGLASFDEAAQRAVDEEQDVPGGLWKLMERAMRRFRSGAPA